MKRYERHGNIHTNERTHAYNSMLLDRKSEFDFISTYKWTRSRASTLRKEQKSKREKKWVNVWRWSQLHINKEPHSTKFKLTVNLHHSFSFLSLSHPYSFTRTHTHTFSISHCRAKICQVQKRWAVECVIFCCCGDGGGGCCCCCSAWLCICAIVSLLHKYMFIYALFDLLRNFFIPFNLILINASSFRFSSWWRCWCNASAYLSRKQFFWWYNK